MPPPPARPSASLFINWEVPIFTLFTNFSPPASGSTSIPKPGDVPLVFLNSEFLTTTPSAQTIDNPCLRLLSAITEQKVVFLANLYQPYTKKPSPHISLDVTPSMATLVESLILMPMPKSPHWTWLLASC